ncbi:MAG: HAD family hydrolase [Acholeplasmataceae bacterium]
MKRIYIFDIDNTIKTSPGSKIYRQTIKLIKTLSKNPNYILGFATGRGPSKLDGLKRIKKYFKYQILVNGAIIIENKKLIYERVIAKEDIKLILDDTYKNKQSLGMVGFNEEAVSFFDDNVKFAFTGYTKKPPVINPLFYLNNKVYQLWMFNKDNEKLLKICNKYPKFKPYLWHEGGLDLTYPDVTKEKAIDLIIKKHPDHLLITIGDGHNDIEMINKGDIGVIMGNSKWKDYVKKETLVAPNINDNKLFDFFKENNLL